MWLVRILVYAVWLMAGPVRMTVVRPSVSSGAFAPGVWHLFPGCGVAIGVTCAATGHGSVATGFPSVATGTHCAAVLHVLNCSYFTKFHS